MHETADLSTWDWVESPHELIEHALDADGRERLRAKLASGSFSRLWIGRGGSASALAPPAAAALVNDLDTGRYLSAELAKLWLRERWRGLPVELSSGVLFTEDRTFGGPPTGAGADTPPYVWERLPADRDPAEGPVQSHLPPDLRPSAPESPSCYYVLELPDPDAPYAEGGDPDAVFEWIDAYGPTCLTLHRLSPELLASRRIGPEDIQAIVDKAVELYLPIYDGESYLIWRPHLPT